MICEADCRLYRRWNPPKEVVYYFSQLAWFATYTNSTLLSCFSSFLNFSGPIVQEQATTLLDMSFAQATMVHKPTSRLEFRPSDRVVRLNRKVAMIRVSIPTKTELEMAQRHETRQSMRIPDTATDTDIDRSTCCSLTRM
jgi:hypothetical protein